MHPVNASLRAPFPWFGGKSRIASTVWDAFGRVQNYVEPFFGSGAVLLARPRSTWANAKGFAEVGARARRAAQRALLLSELERQGWIMSRAAHELGMGTATAVIKALKSLGLAAEYEDARKRGVVMPGRRKG